MYIRIIFYSFQVLVVDSYLCDNEMRSEIEERIDELIFRLKEQHERRKCQTTLNRILVLSDLLNFKSREFFFQIHFPKSKIPNQTLLTFIHRCCKYANIQRMSAKEVIRIAEKRSGRSWLPRKAEKRVTKRNMKKKPFSPSKLQLQL